MLQVNTGLGELGVWNLLRSKTMKAVIMMIRSSSRVRLTERRRVSSDDQA